MSTLHTIVRIPVLKSSFRLIVVSKAPLDGETCDQICSAQGATSVWLPIRWEGIGAPPVGKAGGSVKVWLSLSEEDHSDLLDLFGACQEACQDLAKSGLYRRNPASLPKTADGKNPFVGSYLPIEQPNDPVWFFDGKEVQDEMVLPSDLAKRDLSGCSVLVDGSWVPAMDYPPIASRIVRKPAKPEAPVAPVAPAKPAKPAKPSMVDVTKEVQAKLV
jgi:hypothetical protein